MQQFLVSQALPSTDFKWFMCLQFGSRGIRVLCVHGKNWWLPQRLFHVSWRRNCNCFLAIVCLRSLGTSCAHWTTGNSGFGYVESVFRYPNIQFPIRPWFCQPQCFLKSSPRDNEEGGLPFTAASYERYQEVVLTHGTLHAQIIATTYQYQEAD
jgi:hypothetical protein